MVTGRNCYRKQMTCITDHNCYVKKQPNFNITDTAATNNNYLFQMTNEIKECDIKLYETTEGVLLSSDENAFKLELSELELGERIHLV